jgi:hypothetical protein
MTESRTRIAVGIEALFIALPTTLVVLLMACLDISSAGPIGGTALRLAVLAPPAVCLYFGWRLLFRFLNGGTPELRSSPGYVWVFTHLGAVLSLIGIAAWLIPWQHLITLPPEGGEYPAPIVEFRGLILSAPLLIPYFHLLLQRRLVAESNHRLERPVTQRSYAP